MGRTSRPPVIHCAIGFRLDNRWTEAGQLRAERGFNRESLAHECGINPTYVSAVERAERNVSIDNIEHIAKGLGIEPWMLLREAEP